MRFSLSPPRLNSQDSYLSFAILLTAHFSISWHFKLPLVFFLFQFYENIRDILYCNLEVVFSSLYFSA